MRIRHYTHRRESEELSRFGVWIRKRLDKMGRQQKHLAQAVGLTPGAISCWMRGASVPRTRQIPDMAKFFGVTPDEIFKQLG